MVVVVVELLSERSASAKMFMNRTRSSPLNDESVAVSGAASTVSVTSLGISAVSATAVSVVVSVAALGSSVVVATAAAAAVSVVVVAPAAVVVVATVADVIVSTTTSLVVGAVVVVVVVVVVADVTMLEGCSPNIGVVALDSALLLSFSSSSASSEAQEAAADSCLMSEASREFLSPTELPSCRSSRPTTGNAHSSAEGSSTSSDATISSYD